MLPITHRHSQIVSHNHSEEKWETRTWQDSTARGGSDEVSSQITARKNTHATAPPHQYDGTLQLTHIKTLFERKNMIAKAQNKSAGAAVLSAPARCCQSRRDFIARCPTPCRNYKSKTYIHKQQTEPFYQSNSARKTLQQSERTHNTLIHSHSKLKSSRTTH